MRTTPTIGKAGTVITATSVTRCVSRAGAVSRTAAVLLISEKAFESDREDLVPAAQALASTTASGAWSTRLTVPKAARADDAFLVVGACFRNGPDDEEPTLIYEPQPFLVIEAPRAPVASAVTKSPALTG
jgi:hypothetical protein